MKLSDTERQKHSCTKKVCGHRVLFCAFTMLVEINNGEGQLIVTASPGQSGSTALHIFLMGCDGGYSGVKKSVFDFPIGKIRTLETADTIAKAMGQIGFWKVKEIWQICDAWKAWWQL